MDDKDEKSIYLCKDCGKDKQYLGQIAGTCARYCRFCRSYSEVLFKYAYE